jgi:hypothetical protein
MSGTCHCGARLLASVTFCVECGASAGARPVLVAAAASGAMQQRLTAPDFSASTAASGLAYPPYAAPSRSRPAGGSSWSSGPWIAAMTSAAAVALLVLFAVLAARASSPTVAATATPVASASPSDAVGSSYSPASSGSYSSGASSSGSTGSSSGYSSSEASTTPTATASSDAGNQLTSLLSSDSPEVSTLADQWVPQLSSKQVGMVVQGVTYDDAAILADHEALRARYPQARLILSDDWSVFHGSGYWVTVVAEPFASADAANAWCDQQGIGPNDCFAKKLSHTAGSQDSTKPRS